jgi:hypothetical protein
MNYRRGLQRVYAVLTVVWVAVMLFALPAYRLRFWDAPIDYDALAAKYGAIDDSYATRVKDTKAMAVPPPTGYVLDHSKAWYEAREKQTGWARTDDYSTSRQPPPLPKGAVPLPPDAAAPPAAPIDYGSHSVLVDSGSDQLRIVKSDPLPAPPFSESRMGKATWLTGVLFLPPIFGYTAIFLVIPWIYRGFRPVKQI